MVSVVDAAGVCFSRVWCVFEVFTALVGELKQDFKYDVYTAVEHDIFGHHRHVVGLTDGCAYTNHDMGNQKKGVPEFPGYKQMREAKFPVSMLPKAVMLQLEKGQASVESDRKHILNTIVQRSKDDLDLEPLETHAAYEEVNGLLRSRFAVATLKYGLTQEGEVFEAYLHALSKARMKFLKVDFNFYGDLPREKHEQIVNALPADVELLDMGGVKFMPESFGRLKKLTRVNLCHSKELEALPASICDLPHLKHLLLKNAHSLKALSAAFEKLQNLETLEMKDCEHLKDPAKHPDWSKMPRLKVWITTEGPPSPPDIGPGARK